MDTVETTFKKWQFHWGFAKWQKYSKESTLNGCWYFLGLPQRWGHWGKAAKI